MAETITLPISEFNKLLSGFRRLESKVNMLLMEKQKEQADYLVKAKDVFSLTVWETPEELRQAKKKGQIKQVRKGTGIFYDWNSIHNDFKVLPKNTP